MITERDWLMRAVQQLVQALARALKLVKEERRDEAQDVLRGACVELFGIEYRVLSMVDAASALDLLADAPRGVAFARLVQGLAEAEADPLRREARLLHLHELTQVLLARYPGRADVAALVADRPS